MLVSVVVPTKDRPRALRACLDALSAQTLGERLEVVVVDDGSLGDGDVTAAAEGGSQTRVIRAPGRGPAAARNAGARATGAAYLCFTDDDCIPAPDWAERLLEALEAGADAAAGTTVSGGGVLRDAAELVANAPARAPAPPNSDIPFAPSNNIACTRRAFDATPFDETFPDAAGEDRDWCARLTAGGFSLRLQPKAVVVHRPDLTVAGFARQQLRYGRGAFAFRRQAGERRQLEEPAFYGSLVRRAFGQGARVGLLVCGAQLLTLAGFTAEALRRRRSKAPLTNGER